MTSRDEMKTTGGGEAMLSADELRMMAAFERRSGQGAGGVDEPLDDELEAELADFLTISRRIAEFDREPVAASVRGVVMSEAAKVLAAQEESEAPNGLIAMLMALLRPGPVLAVAAMVALAVAISVRTERPAAVTAEPGMVAMHDEAAGSAGPQAAAAAPLANEAAGAEREKAEARGGEGVGAQAAQPTADEVARADEPAAVAPTGTLNAALERAREPRRDVEERLAKAEPAKSAPAPVARPKRAIAARPAAVDPAGTPPPSDDETDLAVAPARDNKLQQVQQRYAYDSAAKLEAETVAVAAPNPAAATGVTRSAGLVAPSTAPAAAPAPVAAEKALAKKTADAAVEKKEEVTTDADDRAKDTRSDELDKLRGALAKASSSAERVRILERIVALLSADGETSALQQARKELSNERAALAGESGSAKAAPRQKARSAPSSMKR